MEKFGKIWQSILEDKREIYRVHIAHTVRSIALSFVSIYVPVYLLTLHHSLKEVIFFYAVFHISGLFFTLFVVSPLMQKIGLVRIFKFYYPLEIAFYASLYLLQYLAIPVWGIAAVGGMATFIYWVPLNILLVKHSDFDRMGTDLATFFSLPKIFGMVSPLVSAALVFYIGFWPVFLIATLGLTVSYLPLANISQNVMTVKLHWRESFAKIGKRKRLFFLESLDNVIEEADWYWDIYVFLIIGSLAVPGIVGSLSSMGSVLFMFFLGKKTNKDPKGLIVLASLCIIGISLARIFAEGQIIAYVLTIAGAFAMTFFLVPYFGHIYRSVKDKDEEEFIILREVPTVIGRLTVFACILLTLQHPQYFFILPAIVAVVLAGMFLTGKGKHLIA